MKHHQNQEELALSKLVFRSQQGRNRDRQSSRWRWREREAHDKLGEPRAAEWVGRNGVRGFLLGLIPRAAAPAPALRAACGSITRITLSEAVCRRLLLSYFRTKPAGRPAQSQQITCSSSMPQLTLLSPLNRLTCTTSINLSPDSTLLVLPA
jgi:hypothetical protein